MIEKRQYWQQEVRKNMTSLKEQSAKIEALIGEKDVNDSLADLYTVARPKISSLIDSAQASLDWIDNLLATVGAESTVYQSDFDTDEDGWTDDNDNFELFAGNTDAVSDGSISKDDCLALAPSAASPAEIYSTTIALGTDSKHILKRVTLSYLILDDNTNVNGMLLRADSLEPILTLEVLGVWTEIVFYSYGDEFTLSLTKDGAETFTGAGSVIDDLAYISSLKIELLP